MEDILLQYLKNYTDVSDELLTEVINQIPIKAFKKGTVLLKQGETPSKCYFVLKGLVRQYFLDIDGNEHTSNFFSENQVAAVYAAACKYPASKYYLACLEDSILLVGDLNESTRMIAKYPFLETMIRKIMEEIMANSTDEYTDFLTSNPADRYLALLEKRPGLAERVPQNQLASYLGIQPESLSRIKRRLNSHK